jgi:hypothetical protein
MWRPRLAVDERRPRVASHPSCVPWLDRRRHRRSRVRRGRSRKVSVSGTQWGVSTAHIGATEGNVRFDVADLQDAGINTYRCPALTRGPERDALVGVAYFLLPLVWRHQADRDASPRWSVNSGWRGLGPWDVRVLTEE